MATKETKAAAFNELVDSGVGRYQAERMVEAKYGPTTQTQGEANTVQQPQASGSTKETKAAAFNELIDSGVGRYQAERMVEAKYGPTKDVEGTQNPPAVVTRNEAYDAWKNQTTDNGRGVSWTRANYLDQQAQREAYNAAVEAFKANDPEGYRDWDWQMQLATERAQREATDKFVADNKDPTNMNNARLEWEQAEQAAKVAKARMGSLKTNVMSTGGAGGATEDMYREADEAAEAYKQLRAVADEKKQRYQELQGNYYAATAMRKDLGTVTPPEEQPMWNPAHGRVNPMAVTQNLEADRNMEQMTEDEQAVYNYILATQGKEAADDFVSYIQEGLNYRAGLERSNEIESRGRVGKFFGRAETTITGGLEKGAMAVADLFTDKARPTSELEYARMFNSERSADDGIQVRSEEYKALLSERNRLERLINNGQRPEENKKKLADVNSKIQAMEAAGTDREAWKVFGRSTSQLWQDVVGNAANQAISFALSAVNPALGLASLVASSAGSAKQEKLREGWDAESATTYGVLVGAAEGALSKVLGGVAKFGGGKSVASTFTRNVDKIDNVFLRFLANGAGHAIPEFTEEALQTYLAPAFEAVILNTDYEDPGFEEALYSGLIGALYSIPMNAGSVHSATAERATLNTPSVEATAPTVNTQTEAQSFTAPPVSPNANAEAQLYDILFGGRVSNTQATDIANNPVYRQIFAEMGIDLGGMTTVEQRRAVQNKAREMAYQQSQYQQSNGLGGLVENARQNRANAEQSRNAAQEAAQYEQAVRDSGLESYVRGLYLEGMNYTNAKEIYDNPTLRAAFESMSGTSLEGMSRANAVELIRATDLSDYLLPELQPQTAQGGLGGTQISPTTPNASTAQSEGFNQAQTDTATAQVQQGIANGFDMDTMVDIAFEPELQNAFQAVTGESINFDAFPNTEAGRYQAVQDAVNRFQRRKATGQPIDTVQLVADMAMGKEPGRSTVTPVQRRSAVQGVVDDVVNAAVQAKVPSAQTQSTTLTQPQTVSDSTYTAPVGDGAVRERGFSETVRTNPNTEEALRLATEADPDTYRQLSNKTTRAKAEAVFAKGINEAHRTVSDALAQAAAGKKIAPEIVPLTHLVMNELARQGTAESVAEASRLRSALAAELTLYGQVNQAVVITLMSKASPEGVRATFQHILDRINQKYENSRLDYTAELTPAEEQLIANTDFSQDGAYEAVEAEIFGRIGQEMPQSFWKKLSEAGRIGMLLNAKTMVKNPSGNAPLLLLRKGAEKVSAAVQKSLVKSGLMDAAEQTRGFASKEQKQIAKDYYEQNKKAILEGGDKYDVNSILRKYETVFKGSGWLNEKTNGASKEAIKAVSEKLGLGNAEAVMEVARRATYALLEAGDAPFVRSAFQDSLSQYMAAQGITSMDGITQDAIDFAMVNAMEATFKNANALADAANRLKREGGVGAVVVDALLPFTTTPFNIASRMLEYSPAGLITTAISNKSMAGKIDSYSRAAVGSAVIMLGFALRGLGAITGAEDEDKDKRALDRATGKQAYSIGGKHSYEWAQPVGSLLAIGAEMSDAWYGNESLPDFIANSAYTILDTWLDMTSLQGLTSALRGKGTTPGEGLVRATIEGLASRFVPSAFGALARTIDPTVRSTYTDGNMWESIGAKLTAKVPGLSKNLPASVDVRGEEQYRGDAAQRFVDNFVLPWNTNRNETTPVDELIYQLYDETGSKTHFPSTSPYGVEYGSENYKMTGFEREQFQKTQGQTYYELAEGLMETEAFQNATPEQQQKMLNQVNEYALAMAKREYLAEQGVEYELDGTEETMSILKDPAAYLANMAIAKEEAKKMGVDLTPSNPELFKVFLNSDMPEADIEALSQNLTEAQKGYYDGIMSLYPEDREKAKAVYSAIFMKDEYGIEHSGQEQAREVARVGKEQGLTSEEMLEILGVYQPVERNTGKTQDPNKGKPPQVVNRYAYAMQNGLSYEQWAGVEEAIWNFEAENSPNGKGDGRVTKNEIITALSEDGVLADLGISMNADDVYNLFSRSTNDKYFSMEEDMGEKPEDTEKPKKNQYRYKAK